MKLFFAPRTRAVRVRWLLEEIGAPYEIERVEPPPLSAVLIDGAATLTESSAACLYLADRYGEGKLAPAPDASARADYLQWLLFTELSLEPAIVDQIARVVRPESAPTETPRLAEHLALIQDRLSGREFVAGDAFSAADVVLSSVLHRAHAAGQLRSHQALSDYVLRHTRRPASIRAVRT